MLVSARLRGTEKRLINLRRPLYETGTKSNLGIEVAWEGRRNQELGLAKITGKGISGPEQDGEDSLVRFLPLGD